MAALLRGSSPRLYATKNGPAFPTGPELKLRHRGCCGVRRIAPGQDRIEDERQKDEPDGKSSSFAKTFGYIERCNDVGNRKNEKPQKNPPRRTTSNFVQYDIIVDRHDRSPPRLSGLREDLPESCDHQNDDCQPDDHGSHADSGSGRITPGVI